MSPSTADAGAAALPAAGLLRGLALDVAGRWLREELCGYLADTYGASAAEEVGLLMR
jgi:hypothetical protein